jgi:hypothetical protein
MRVRVVNILGNFRTHKYNATTRPPGRTWYPLYRRLSGPQGRSGRVQKISPPPAFDPQTIRPVASRYTEYAIPAQYIYIINTLHLGGEIKLVH